MVEEMTHARHIGGRLDAARESELLEVTLALLAEVGYESMSMDEIARRAHASKATIYRRWPSKADLVAAAILGHKIGALKPPPAETLRDDLVAELGCLCQESTAARALAQALLTALRTDPYLAELIRHQSGSVMQQDVAAIVARAVERGELPAKCERCIFTVADVAQALIGTRLLFSGKPLDSQFIEYTVDNVLLPLLRAGPPLP
jgi:AcrR family transcriptional regulator